MHGFLMAFFDIIQIMSLYYLRAIENRLKNALKQFPVCLVTGPRQAGKSTLLQNLMPDYKYVTLDDPLNRQLAIDDPALFLSQYSTPIILDEVQNAPGLFPYIKMKVDQNRRVAGQFILTGSQSFQLMEGVNESLAGRVALFHLYPFTWSEIEGIPGYKLASKDDQKCIGQILKGFYPEFFKTENLDSHLWHGSYITTYIERDIRNIRSISDLGRFQTFIGLLATRAGKLLNLSEVAKECGISQPTAKDWVSILESAYIIYLLKPYHANLSKRLVKSPKLYFIDTGILCYLLGIDSPDRFMRSTEREAIFENMVIMEYIKKLNSQPSPYKVYFYRTATGTEIDFLCEYQGRLLASEIKFSKSLSKDMAKSLLDFNKDCKADELTILSLYESEISLTQDVKAKHWSSLLSDL